MNSAAEILAIARQAGLPEDMSPELWARLETQVRHEDGDPYLGLAVVEFDTETIDGPGPSPDGSLGSYTDIICLLAANSDGKFAPTAIIDELVDCDAHYRVGFTHRGQAFEVKVENQSDWFQGEVVDLINQALEATQIPQRFHLIPVLDQIAYLAFLSKPVCDRAQALGLWPSIDELLAENGLSG
ncbi:MAG: hypothetical protein AB4042_15615 [Leptolyngbyaceae cyanobacterium]